MVAPYFGALNPYFAALNKAVYLMVVGGAAYRVSKMITARVLAFKDLGMAAIYEFEVKNIPVAVCNVCRCGALASRFRSRLKGHKSPAGDDEQALMRSVAILASWGSPVLAS